MSPIVTKIYMMIAYSLVKDPPYYQKELYSYYFKTLNFYFKIIPPTSMVYYLNMIWLNVWVTLYIYRLHHRQWVPQQANIMTVSLYRLHSRQWVPQQANIMTLSLYRLHIRQWVTHQANIMTLSLYTADNEYHSRLISWLYLSIGYTADNRLHNRQWVSWLCLSIGYTADNEQQSRLIWRASRGNRP